MIHVELTVMKITCSIIVIGCSVILQLVKTIDVLHGEAIVHVPSNGRLSSARIEGLVIQAIGRCADVAAI